MRRVLQPACTALHSLVRITPKVRGETRYELLERVATQHNAERQKSLTMQNVGLPGPSWPVVNLIDTKSIRSQGALRI